MGYASDILVARGCDEWKLFLSPEVGNNTVINRSVASMLILLGC